MRRRACRSSRWELGHQLLERAGTAGGGHTADSVVSGHERILRRTVIAMHKGAVLAERENPGEATAHVLRGRVRLPAGGLCWEGWSSELLVVPDARHSLEAMVASAVLQAVAKLPCPCRRSNRPFSLSEVPDTIRADTPALTGWSFNVRRLPMADAKVQVRRAYEEPAQGDGTRVLVERTWRSLKASAGFDQHSDQGVIRLGAGPYRDPQLARGRKRTHEGERMTASMDDERTGAPSSPATEHEEGGDSACWAQRVCPEHGRLDQAEHPHEREACLAAQSRPL